MFKRNFASFLFIALVICSIGAAQAYAAPAGTNDDLVYGYFSHRGSQNLMVVSEAVTAPPPCTMALPAGKKVFTYTPVEAPVLSCDPAKAKPIGVGSISENILEVAVDIGPFDKPVDVSFGYFAASFDAADIFFLNIFDQITSLQDELAAEPTVQAAGNGQGLKSYHANHKKRIKKLTPWKSNVLGVTETLLGPLDLQGVPPGLYVLVLNVTRSSPADDNFDRFYRWVTYFIVPDPAE